MKLFDRIRENKNRPDEEERLMFEMEQIGKRIAGLRKSHNMTQQDLADQLGVTYQAVSNWERGLSMPDVVRLKDLASFFGLSLDEIMGNENDARIVRVASKEQAAETIGELVESAPYMKPKDLEDELLQKAGLTKAGPEETTEEAELPAINPGGKAGQTESAQSPIAWMNESKKRVEFKLEDLLEVAPFISSEPLSLLVKHLIASDGQRALNFLPQLAPFLEPEDLNRLVEDCLNSASEFSEEIILALLPHMDDEFSGVQKILRSSSIQPEFLIKMAPFLDSETLSQAVRSFGSAKKLSDEITIALAPFLEAEDIEYLLKQADVTPALLRKLLPFTDTDIVDELIHDFIEKK